MKFRLPYDITPLEEELNSEIKSVYRGVKNGFVQVGPKKYFREKDYTNHAETIYNFKVRPEDVWIVTVPRSGTTLTQEMTWLVANDMDFDKALTIPLTERFPFLEYSTAVDENLKAEVLNKYKEDEEKLKMVEDIIKPKWVNLSKCRDRRFIKTHMPLSLLPPDLLTCGCKVIYVARNPKDVAISMYNLHRTMRNRDLVADFPTFWDMFEKGLVIWTPYWPHVLEGWKKKDEQNLLFMFYEDILKDKKIAIEKVANFFDKSYSESKISQLVDHLHVDNCRKNESLSKHDALEIFGVKKEGVDSRFVRNGLSKNWHEKFTPDLNERADRWIEENYKFTDLRFPL